MLYENEFALLTDTFKKSRVRIIAADVDSCVMDIIDEGIKPFYNKEQLENMSLKDAFGEIEERTLYKFEDNLTLLYTAFLKIQEDSREFIVIGPYLDEPLSNEGILEISERNGFDVKNQKVINDFFSSVPVINESNSLFLLLDCFCERMWQGRYEVISLQGGVPTLENMMGTSVNEKAIDDTFLDMKNMEKRYTLENEIMDAVANASEHKVKQLLSSFASTSFEKRLSDPIRNSKNYCIIMNTLLRKAAERGGVHPMYLNKMSSDFAFRIERVSTATSVESLMTEMFRSYCALVKKHSIKRYSPLVKKAVMAIELDVSAELNLHILSKKLNVSGGYLSSIFKKETGKTITEFIRDRRLAHAMYLLKSTTLQIQTVALHCGILDVQYFSKMFKKHIGKTPSEYRQDAER